MDEFIKIATLFGMGGIIGALVNHWLSQKADSKAKLYNVREERYRNILAHMSVLLNPVNTKFINHCDPATGRQLNADDHIDFLNAEYYHACLYAPDAILKELKIFVEAPSEDGFIKVAQTMRKDLWSKKSELTDKELKLANKALQPTPKSGAAEL